MSFLLQSFTKSTKVITQQPTSSNSVVAPSKPEPEVNEEADWIPAIEHAILKLKHKSTQTPVNESSKLIQATAPGAPSASNDKNEPQSKTKYDSKISKAFQTNDWRDIVINGQQFFNGLSTFEQKLLEEAVKTSKSAYYVKITLDVAESRKCGGFYEFLTMYNFVKKYIKNKEGGCLDCESDGCDAGCDTDGDYCCCCSDCDCDD